MSPPVWGAWIEIVVNAVNDVMNGMSPPVWGAWIEITTGMCEDCG